MKYREIRKSLMTTGCTYRNAKGDHEVWYCPCGQHMVVVVTSPVVSPGVVGDIIKKMACLGKGWLQ